MATGINTDRMAAYTCCVLHVLLQISNMCHATVHTAGYNTDRQKYAVLS